MAEHNKNSISPFLVNRQKEGAEKALFKVIAALFPERLHFFFSYSLVSRASANPSIAYFCAKMFDSHSKRYDNSEVTPRRLKA